MCVCVSERERERFEEATALKVEEETISQRMKEAFLGRGKETDCPLEPLEGTQPEDSIILTQ